MILQTLIWGLLKPWRKPSGDTKSDIWCLNDLHFHWYSVGSLRIMKLFKGDFYFIAWGKMNAWCNILKFVFLKCHILVLEEGLLFQNLTHVMQFVVKHDSFLDRKPFHCQIHVGRKFCFPGCRDSRQKHQQPESRALRELFCWVFWWTLNFPNHSQWLKSTIQKNTYKTHFPEVCTLLISLAQW